MSAESKNKLRAQARSQLIDEFILNDQTLDRLEDQLGQEPYNMVKGRDGQSKPSTRLTLTVEQIWTMNKGKPDSKGRRQYNDQLQVGDQQFSRRALLSEPVLRTDVQQLLRDQFNDIGYRRCYFKEVYRTDHHTNKEYKTYLVQIHV